MVSHKDPMPLEPPDHLIFEVRGQKIMLDSDLARIYGVPTKRLNEQIRRNHQRFPEDFMFRLSREEAAELVRSRSQFATLKRGQNIKYLPYAFTEHGAIMAANVLNSPRAAQMSVVVVRAFVRLRQFAMTHKELSHKLADLERKYDAQFKVVFDAIRRLMTPPPRPRRPIGFHAREETATEKPKGRGR